MLNVLMLLLAAALLAAPASAVSFDWVEVGAPGNPCDPQPQGCFGAVSAPYLVAKYEVTNAQYAEFLNAIAATDTNGLYHPNMGLGLGGIARSGASGSFRYQAVSGREDLPVNFVTFYDSMRFANWLHNLQPSGTQDATTTEDGAYTISAGGVAANSIARNPQALIFLPSEDEWYKAAYFAAISASYFDYPAGSDQPTRCAAPSSDANTANCGSAAGDLTSVGRYTASASPNGTFDQGGNVREWNETPVDGTLRGLRGGGFANPVDSLGAAGRGSTDPNFERVNIGIRVAASVPEPGTALLLAAGLAWLAARRMPRRG